MFGSEKAKNGYTLMVQMYFALQINQKRRTGMNSISEKELLALNDLLGEEELLIKKFKMLANHAEDEEIKDKFEQISERHQKHFDYLYKQYTEERIAYLQKYKKISEYDSENLMYSLIQEIIADNKYLSLDVVCHFPLNMLIKNPELLNEQECQYAMNPATHLDFLIYNRIGKKPVLAIEVDGYEYHKEDTVQASRDLLKNHIMELYEVPLLRFMTNGSGEKEKIIEMLDKLVG